jgi:hypothetical protein
MQRTSIIIVNYNGKHFLKDCFDSIRSSESPNEEVILVDNASIDGSLEYMRSDFPWVKVIPLDKNVGFAEATNIGAKAASGSYLAFLNNDTVVSPKWLTTLIHALSTDPAAGAAGSKLLLYNRPGIVNSAGANITFNGGGYDIGFGDLDTEQYSIPSPRGAVCAASMLVRRKEFLAFGGFDSMYFMYFEDVDLCWRYWLFGQNVQYVPSSVVLHRFGGTSGSDRHVPLRVFYGMRNSIINVIKNMEFHTMVFPLCFNAVFATGKCVAFLASFRLKSAWAVLRAVGSVIYNLPQILRKRKDIQQRRQVNDKYLYQHALIATVRTCTIEYIRLWKLS